MLPRTTRLSYMMLFDLELRAGTRGGKDDAIRTGLGEHGARASDSRLVLAVQRLAGGGRRAEVDRRGRAARGGGGSALHLSKEDQTDA